jgi:hypothetical protein|tara:strand:+ start:283 stop:507 length:225 start_codon:yes stop_codon:yes gene_type:complete
VDVFGFAMTICVFILLWKRPKGRLFFYTMYLLEAILEIGGPPLDTGNGQIQLLVFLSFYQVTIRQVALVYSIFC